MNSSKVGIVIVTYNRKQLLKRLLDSIVNQSYENFEVFVVDNACTDGTEEYIKETINSDSRFHYKRMETNTGGSGGFSEGVKLAFEANMGYIWGMDDDALPAQNALEKLVETAKKAQEKVCLVSYTIEDLNGDEAKELKNNKPELIEKEHFLFLGFFVSHELVKEIGLPKKELFIYFDDIDYSYRAKNAGYKVYMVRDSLIQHPPMMLNTKKFKILGAHFEIQEMVKWKWYYYMRNGQMILPKTKLVKKSMFKTLIGCFFAYPKCFPAALTGYIHGKKGITGKSKKY